MKKLAVFLLLLLSIISITHLLACISGAGDKRITEARLTEAIKFCKVHQMNTRYCIMVDMSIHPGKNRMFVYDLQHKKIIIEGLCAHGAGGGSTGLKAIYSNVDGSHCTSIGKYKIGIRSYSRWGINVHYKLHGLESTNDNAYSRNVVLHSYNPVPSVEVFPLTLPLGYSYGCPVTANATMTSIDKLIQGGEKDMLSWIYE